jgi:hypothetical protein
MKKRAELAELAAQVAEHLRYREELGLESIGEINKPSAKPKAQQLPDQGSAKIARQVSSIIAPGAETLDEIRADLGECQRCKLWKTRTNLVFGEGNPKAELMFIGEAPGADEDASGRPFVGRAGQLLTKMIEAIGMKRGRRLHCQCHQVASSRKSQSGERRARCLRFVRPSADRFNSTAADRDAGQSSDAGVAENKDRHLTIARTISGLSAPA